MLQYHINVIYRVMFNNMSLRHSMIVKFRLSIRMCLRVAIDITLMMSYDR